VETAVETAVEMAVETAVEMAVEMAEAMVMQAPPTASPLVDYSAKKNRYLTILSNQGSPKIMPFWWISGKRGSMTPGGRLHCALKYVRPYCCAQIGRRLSSFRVLLNT
jgi:hypothetical protein